MPFRTADCENLHPGLRLPVRRHDPASGQPAARPDADQPDIADEVVIDGPTFDGLEEVDLRRLLCP